MSKCLHTNIHSIKYPKCIKKKYLLMRVGVNGINIKLVFISVKTKNAGQLSHLHPK